MRLTVGVVLGPAYSALGKDRGIESTQLGANCTQCTPWSQNTRIGGCTMLSRLFPVAVALLLGCSMFAASPLAAQEDCGTTCAVCNISGYEGRSYNAQGTYNMSCFGFIPYCVACHGEPERVADAPREAEAIVWLIESTPAAELREALAEYRNRLLFAPGRNLIVVQGNDCNPDALATVLFVRPEKAHALRSLGLRSLNDYLKGT